MKVIYDDPTKEEKLFEFKMGDDGLLLGDFGNKIIKEDTPGEFRNAYNKYIDSVDEEFNKLKGVHND